MHIIVQGFPVDHVVIRSGSRIGQEAPCVRGDEVVCAGGLGRRVLVIIVCCSAGFNSIPTLRDNIKGRRVTYFTDIHLLSNIHFGIWAFLIQPVIRDV